MTPDRYKQLVQRIREVVPAEDDGYARIYPYQPITLAMVLRCLEYIPLYEYQVSSRGSIYMNGSLIYEYAYDLTKDSLDAQSDEFKDFLANLLLNKN